MLFLLHGFRRMSLVQSWLSLFDASDAPSPQASKGAILQNRPSEPKGTTERKKHQDTWDLLGKSPE
jgi:hypothetical protein